MVLIDDSKKTNGEGRDAGKYCPQFAVHFSSQKGGNQGIRSKKESQIILDNQ